MSDVTQEQVQEGETATVAAVPKKMKMTETHREGSVVVFNAKFANGEEHEFTLDPSHPLYHSFAVHGARQKLSDAGSTKKTADDAAKAVGGLIEALEAGEWSQRGTGGDGEPTGGLLAKALANLYGKPLSEVQTYLAGLSDEPKERTKIHNALRAQAEVAAEIERIRPPKKERKVNDAAAKAAAEALAGLAN
jgi:hypothetical protein